jgi:Rrf2 family protein
MLSQTAEHALRAILYLAQQNGDGPIAADHVAEALGAPRNYLSKTLHELARQGILDSTPGRRGGFVLAVRPDRLSIAEIVSVFDAPRKNPICLLGGRPCNDREPCAAHAHWKQVEDRSRRPLEDTTVADLLADVPAA